LLGAAPSERRIPRTVARVRRQREAGQFVGIADCSNAAADGGGPDLALCFMGQESRHAFGRGWERAHAALGAPGAYLEVGTVGPPRGRSLFRTRVFGGGRYLPSGQGKRLTSGQPSRKIWACRSRRSDAWGSISVSIFASENQSYRK
jgi:hypothetical protein